MKRRDFIKYTGAGVATIVLGSKLPWMGPSPAYAVVPLSLKITIDDAIKQMATFNAINPSATCYFWTYQMEVTTAAGTTVIPPEVPGPNIFTTEGQTIPVTISNNLDEPHNFAIPGIGYSSGNIAAGAQNGIAAPIVVPANSAGSYLYYDTVVDTVNRMMGLHGAFIVMPDGVNGTPYSAAVKAANPKMAQLFDDLGAAAWWPGLAWGAGAANPDRPDIFGVNQPIPDTPAFRQYIWLLHQPSPVLFDAVRAADPGTGARVPATFIDRFLNDPLVTQGANKPPLPNNTPQYFTINGQSGHFSHNSPAICPNLRVGEPCVIRVLNAGMWTHSMHIHANHVYVLQVNNLKNVDDEFTFGEFLPGQTDNHIWVDTMTAEPLGGFDWLVPYMQPPDVPNDLGIGRKDLQRSLPVAAAPVKKFGVVVKNAALETLKAGNTVAGVSTWPPRQELNMAMPKVGTNVKKIPIHVPLSPLCFPMHDHSEPTQTSQGGNYNTGLIAGLNFTGDRNAPDENPANVATFGKMVVGNVQTFPNAQVVFGPEVDGGGPVAVAEATGAAAGPLPPFEEVM